MQAAARSLADTDHLVEQIHGRFGSLTTLFRNAGVSRRTPLATADEAGFDELFAINTTSPPPMTA